MVIINFFIIALSLIFGVLSARFFKNLKIPQVVGYIIIGLILGTSFLNILDQNIINEFRPINYVALGFIGFLVGGELKLSIFRKYGRSIIVILLLEGIFAFIFVTLLTYIFTKNIALSIILGSLASATAPAATVDVLWEYKAAGELTTMVFTIVALDDALALFLYSFSNSIAKTIIKHKSLSIFNIIGKPSIEILIAAMMGASLALFLKYILKYTEKYKRDKDLLLSFILGLNILIIAMSLKFGTDLILAEMFFGFTFVNIAPYYSKKIFDLIKQFYPPIFLLFFVLAGARLHLNNITIWLIIASLLYLFGRTFGKFLGSYIGAKITHSPDKIARYLGFCLLSQAGVTIGLAISSYNELPELGLSILNIVTLTTFIVQIIGPPSVKFAISKAKEINRRISDQEILEHISVNQVVIKNATVIPHNYDLENIFKTIKTSPYDIYFVVNDKQELIGQFDLTTLKPLLYEDVAPNLVIAMDIVLPVIYKLRPDDNLRTAYSFMKNSGLPLLPVVDNNNKIIGIITAEQIRQILKKKSLLS